MRPWKTRSRRTVLDHGRFLIVEDHTVELPDGRVLSGWPWIITPDFVTIVAATADGKYLCFRQTKYAVQGTSLAPAGGYLEPGEDPLVAAQRELLEETGHKAEKWIDLGHYPVDGNRGAGTAHLFLALGAHRVAPIDADDLEEQELLYIDRAEVVRALLSGEFKALPWTAAIALALQYMEEQGG
jgi:8-oxo-dGTP pyrophosphatase MutT (NUDIX family)